MYGCQIQVRSSLVPLTAAYAPDGLLHFLDDYSIIQTVSMHFPKTSGHLDSYCLLELSYGRHTGRMLLFSLAPTPSPLVLTSPWFLLRDRKSTRLNSSHVAISYAVFCLE